MAGYLRHAHEQNLISTIEEGRKETQEEFYRVLEERQQRDWEARKKRVFEQLGGRIGGENLAVAELKKSMHGKSSLSVRAGMLPSCFVVNVLLDGCRPCSQSANAEQDDGVRPCSH